MDLSQILPCPFCGAEAEMHSTDDGADYIECTEATCQATTSLQYSIKDDGRPQLIERWNRRYSTERLAAWMIENSFATGHGDTFSDLIGELTWQVQEQRNKYIEALRSIAANTCCDKCQEAALVAKKALGVKD